MPTSAVVTADTRQCSTVDDTIYQLNDTAEKLHIVDNTIVTMGGVDWICNCIFNLWKDGVDHSPRALHGLTLRIVPHIGEMATELGIGHMDFLSNPYMLEFCLLQYDPQLGHNVFYHIATSTGYQLERFDVDGAIHPSARMFGGVDCEIVQGYLDTHPEQAKWNYPDTVHTGYELAVSEKIGGMLMIATQDKGNITLSQRKLNDSRPLLKIADLLATASNVVGKNLLVQCPDVNGGVSKVRIDSMGLFQYNGRYYMAGDGGGRIGMDSHWGIFGGPQALFDVTDTGYVKPSFVGNDGKIILDKEGFPKDTDFLLGMERNHFFRGTVVAQAGKFNGDLYANNLFFNDGGDVKTLLSQSTKKIPSGLLDLGKLQLDGITGNITMAGDINMGGNINMGGSIKLDGDISIGGNLDFSNLGKITWGKQNPVKYQYSSVSETGPWHDICSSNDKYRRESFDGGIIWNPGYQFWAEDGADGRPGRDGQDGRNGSDAEVTRGNIVLAMLENAPDDGLYTVDIDGRPCLGINASAIKAGVIKGREIRGCTITADTTIDVGTDASIGNKLIINANNYSNGVEFRYADGTKVAGLDIDPTSRTLFITSASGKVVINGQEYSPYSTFY